MADNSNQLFENHFVQVHSIIHLHRSRALPVVNNESLFICWNVGQYVSERLKKSDWGKKVVTQHTCAPMTQARKGIAAEIVAIWLHFSKANLLCNFCSFCQP